ncbi:MAG: carbon storage regulator CsrA [Gammaproteobacteria bacterium]
MLVLTRRIGETVMMGNDIAITVLSIQGGQIRIGMDAPSSVKIFRQEVYDRIQEETKTKAKKQQKK